MTNNLPNGVIQVRGLRLWAHVGVLERERLLGQWFELDFYLWYKLENAAKKDDIKFTLDYSLGIYALRDLSDNINCYTMEHFSERILNCLEDLYGILPMKIILRKCHAPINGFSGDVGIERSRNLQIYNN